jgi:hypothetical protein
MQCDHGSGVRWRKSYIQWYLRAKFWYRIYGLLSPFLVVFGSGDVWYRLYILLNDSDDKKNDKEKNESDQEKKNEIEKEIEEFRKSHCEECSMTVLAVSIPGLPLFANFLLKFSYLRELLSH